MTERLWHEDEKKVSNYGEKQRMKIYSIFQGVVWFVYQSIWNSRHLLALPPNFVYATSTSIPDSLVFPCNLTALNKHEFSSVLEALEWVQ